MIELRRISFFVDWKAIRGKKSSGVVVFPAARHGKDLAPRSNAFEGHFNAEGENSEKVVLYCVP